MVIKTTSIRKKRPNYFMTDNEVGILWKHIWKHYSTKYGVMLAIGLFRGLRIGEICAVNVLDLKQDYTKLRVIMSKSHIEDDLELIPQLSNIIKEYVYKNHYTFKDGYLFPFYNNRANKHLDPRAAESWFAKVRQEIGKEHPSFLDHRILDNGQRRYRISWHSCRRWFETRIYDHNKDKKRLADIMRYLKINTVDTYIDPYETWKQERNILEGVFDERIRNLQNLQKGQTQLLVFIN